MSCLLDSHPEIISLLENDLIDQDCQPTGRKGLSVESVFRCLLLKKLTGAPYEMLAFYLSDSASYRSFARIDHHQVPGKSSLQANIRRIKPQTLKAVFDALAVKAFEIGRINPKIIRIDSTVVKIGVNNNSNFLPKVRFVKNSLKDFIVLSCYCRVNIGIYCLVLSDG